jgi:cell wall-associated NlpC family hydrolase
MVTEADIAAEAWTWLGTPVAHGQRLKGVGCDCIGYVGGVGFATGALPPLEQLRGLARFAGYSRQPDGRLRAALDEYLVPAEPGPGRVVLMEFLRGQPQHLGILVPYPHGGMALIHAMHDEVRAHRLDDRWTRRVVAAYRFPGVACS